MDHCFWDLQDNQLPDEFWNLHQDDWQPFDELHRSFIDLNPNRRILGFQTPSSRDFIRPLNPVMLHTPPHSPPFSPSCENDLDSILNAFPEILETVPPISCQDFDSILFDLQSSLPNEEPGFPLLLSYGLSRQADFDSRISPVKDLVDTRKSFAEKQQTVKRDIMLSWGCDLYSTSGDESPQKRPPKLRTFSETSSDGLFASAATLTKLSPVKYSEEVDEECEHLPETPGMSDVDIEDADVVDIKIQIPELKATIVNASVSSEHNYCGRGPLDQPNICIDTPSSSDTDEEVDVDSMCSSQPSFETNRLTMPSTFDEKPTIKIVYKPAAVVCPSSLAGEASPTTAVVLPAKGKDGTQPFRSLQVKKQLQISIQESIKSRESKKAVRSIKKEQLDVDSIIGAGSLLPKQSPSDRLSLATFRPHGKPEAYTKRIREQHQQQKEGGRRKRRKIGGSEITYHSERRVEHNAMERKRRVGLKNLFDDLKELLPSSATNKRASKIMILREAELLCQQYCRVENSRRRLIEDQTRLLQKLHVLDKRAAQTFRCSNPQICL